MFGTPFTETEYSPKILNALSKRYCYFENFSVKKIITSQDIINDDTYKDIKSMIGLTNRVMDLKEKKIREALKELYEIILERYQKLAEYYKLELTPENFHEDVLQDVTFYDLIPGNTAISFEIKTTRCLVRN